MKKKDYDLLIVGAGIYGATAAYKPSKRASAVLSLTSVHTLVAISIAKTLKASMCTNTVLIFSIQATNACGNLSIVS